MGLLTVSVVLHRTAAATSFRVCENDKRWHENVSKEVGDDHVEGR